MWEHLIGQQRLKEQFSRALRARKMTGAFLFVGDEGVGKSAAAIAIASCLLCETSGAQVEACGTCQSCERMKTLSHPDFALVVALPVGKGETASDDPTAKLTEAELENVRNEIIAKANNPYHHIMIDRATSIKISSVRAIRQFLSLSTMHPQGRKVVLVLESDLMRPQAQNAFLKTLEEPRGIVTIILTTTHPDRLLETVRSRTQRINFSLLHEDDIAGELQKRGVAFGDEARTVAAIAEGSFSKALALRATDVETEREEAINFLRSVLKSDWVAIASWIDRWSREERTDTDRRLALLTSWMRDALSVREGALPIMKSTILEKFSAGYSQVRFSQAITRCDESRRELRSNVRPQTVWHSLAAGLQEIFLIVA